MKKIIIGFLCAVIMISAAVFASCSNAGTSSNPGTDKSGMQTSVQIPNPLVNYGTIDEAKKAVGFNFMVPAALPDGYEMKDITVIGKIIAQISYLKGDSKILYRTSKGNEDISGDYNDYNSVKTITAGNAEITVKGNGDGINLATWTRDGASFSLSFDEAVGEKTLSAIIESIK